MNHFPSDHSQCQEQKWGFSYFSETNEEQTETFPEFEQIPSSYPLAQAQKGKSVWLVGFQGKGGMNRLLGMGLTPGVALKIISSQPSGSVLVSVNDSRIGIGAGIAQKILVSDQPLTKEKERNMVNNENILLRNLTKGTKGRVVGYDQVRRGYKGKLLSMGLTPGTEFIIIRVAPLGDPVEILVRGFHLSLRKHEADALIIEIV